MEALKAVARQSVRTVADLLLVDETTALALLVAVFVIVFTTLYLFGRGSGSKQRIIALVGRADAGKTQLFSELVGARGVQLVTSVKENVMDGVDFGKKQWQLVDVPGSEKVRRQIFDHYKAQLKGIVFVVDSCTFSKESKDVAECFYDFLSDSAVKKIPILVSCNKQDLPLAKAQDVVRKQLEKEFSALNKTKSAALETTHGADERRTLGKAGSEFNFDQLSQKILFCECWSKSQNGTKRANVKLVREWLANI